MSSLRFIDPSSNLGIAACPGMLSARLSIAALVLSFEPVMSAIPDSKAGAASHQSHPSSLCLHQLSRRDLMHRQINVDGRNYNGGHGIGDIKQCFVVAIRKLRRIRIERVGKGYPVLRKAVVIFLGKGELCIKLFRLITLPFTRKAARQVSFIPRLAASFIISYRVCLYIYVCSQAM